MKRYNVQAGVNGTANDQIAIDLNGVDSGLRMMMYAIPCPTR